jgi:PAS domain S-box-containing protein
MGEEARRVTSALRRFSTAAGITAATVGILVLVGWALDVPLLKSVLPHLVSMKANTALCFLLAGISLWLAQERQGDSHAQLRLRLSQAAAAAAAALSLLTLSEHLFGWDLGIDQLLFREAPGAVETTSPGRMSPQSAVISILFGAGLLLLEAKNKWARLAGPFFTLLGSLISFVAVLGYAYNAEDIYQISSLNGMALHAALAFFVLGLGILAARPERAPMDIVTRGFSGRLAARLLLAALVLPGVLGWLTWHGQEKGLFGSDVGTALLVASTTLIFLGLIYWTAHSLNRMEEARGRASSKFKVSEDRLNLALRSSGVGTWDWDLADNSVIWDEHMGPLVGLPPEPHHPTYEVALRSIHPEDREQVAQAHAEAVQGKDEYRNDCRVVWPDGTIRYLASRGRVERNEQGMAVRMAGASWDITEHARAEEALRRSEASLRSLVDNAPYAIYKTNVDAGRFTSVNPALVAMLGYESEAEVLALDLPTQVYRNPEARARMLPELERLEHFEDLELEWKRKDGKLLLLRTSGRLVQEGTGARFFEAIAEDISERRLLEQQFRQAQKMEAIGQLAGGVAHDFNNLLMVVSSFSEMMSEAGPTNEKQQHYLQEILKAARRGAGLTQQLLAFSRKQALAPSVLDLNSVANDFGKMLPPLIGEHIEVRLLTKAQNGKVEADPGQLEQILMNLAVNARDAMPKGGTLVIEVDDLVFDQDRVSSNYTIPAGSYVLLAVSDNGEGMARETLEHIFEPFFTTKERGKGTGLGLSTVYGIVKQSGGYIAAYSEPGVGTTFKIYLPRVDKPAAPAPVKPEPFAAGGSETILLVEDEQAVRIAARVFLEMKGYAVLEAADGTEGLRVHAQHPGPIHLLITDVVMPGGTGRELAEKLQRLDPRLRVLYISGYTGGSVGSMAGLDPGTSFLQKPFALETLARTARSVLDAAPQESSAR